MDEFMLCRFLCASCFELEQKALQDAGRYGVQVTGQKDLQYFQDEKVQAKLRAKKRNLCELTRQYSNSVIAAHVTVVRLTS